MAELIASRSITLNAANPLLQSPKVSIGQLTGAIEVRLRRPTTALPLAWNASGRVKLTLVMVIDGVEYTVSAQASGGIRSARGGGEGAYWGVRWEIPIVKVAGLRYRLGERATTECAAYLRLERIAGTINSEIQIAATTERALETRLVSNSVGVTYDTSVSEVFGDGAHTMSVTPSGTNRNAFAAAWSDDGTNNISATFGGTGMTELADTGGMHGVWKLAAYKCASEPSTSTQDVVITQATYAGNWFHAGVMLLENVDTTTSTGNTSGPTATQNDPVSISLTGVNAGDLSASVAFFDGTTGVPVLAAGTENEKNNVYTNGYFCLASRVGSGSISWSGHGAGGSTYNGIYGVVYKEAAGAAAGALPPPRRDMVFM